MDKLTISVAAGLFACIVPAVSAVTVAPYIDHFTVHGTSTPPSVIFSDAHADSKQVTITPNPPYGFSFKDTDSSVHRRFITATYKTNDGKTCSLTISDGPYTEPLIKEVSSSCKELKYKTFNLQSGKSGENTYGLTFSLPTK